MKKKTLFLCTFLACSLCFGCSSNEQPKEPQAQATQVPTKSAISEREKFIAENTDENVTKAIEDSCDYIYNDLCSREGLIERLKKDGYSEANIEGALYSYEDVVDWKEQAKNYAVDYLVLVHCSVDELKQELLDKKFTDEEVQYALENIAK